MVAATTDEPLTHNPLRGVTAGVWKRGSVVHKVLTRRRQAPPHWASSEDPRHWNYAGDTRLVRLGICASAVKYDWLTAACLEHAGAEEHLDYGRDASVDADQRVRERR
jgi:hypothetical protein